MIIDCIFGLLPETIYFTMFLIFCKNIKEKRIWLGICIGIAYFICILISKYRVLYYVGFIMLVQLILMILYNNKTQNIDIFVFSISTIYISVLSMVLGIFVQNSYTNYYILYCINKVLLFLPFIFHKKFNQLYNVYASLWNRDDTVKKPVKSISVRNISLIVINIFIFILNITTIGCMTLFK